MSLASTPRRHFKLDDHAFESTTMTTMRLFLVALLAVATVPTCISFQSITSRPLSTSVQKAAPRSPLKTPPRAGDAPLLASSVNGDTKATFGVDGSLAAKTSAVVAATVATYALHNQLTAMGPVQASGIVALASTLLLPEKLALAALCGSFAGMAKAAVVPTLFSAGLLGVVCAGVLGLFDRKKWLIGFGGRLGFISQCACTLQFLVCKYGQKAWQASEVLGATLGTTASTAMLADFSLYESMTLCQIKTQVPTVVLSTVGGALFMRLWKHLTAKLPNKVSNSVAAVGMTGLLGGDRKSVV